MASIVNQIKGRRFIRKGLFIVYILECCDGSYYTGYTNDLPARLKLHENGKGSRYVRSRHPFRLVYQKTYRYFRPAVMEELRIKSLCRLEKERLVVTYIGKEQP